MNKTTKSFFIIMIMIIIMAVILAIADPIGFVNKQVKRLQGGDTTYIITHKTDTVYIHKTDTIEIIAKTDKINNFLYEHYILSEKYLIRYEIGGAEYRIKLYALYIKYFGRYRDELLEGLYE